jgi:RNA polymerase sigma factor (sigma-70 family)
LCFTANPPLQVQILPETNLQSGSKMPGPLEPLHENSVDAAQDDGGVEIVDGRPTPEEILCESERRATVRQAVAHLRESLRVVVLLGELQGLTSAETARHLGLTVSAVKARTFHARRFLRKHLERNFESPSVLSKAQKRPA